MMTNDEELEKLRQQVKAMQEELQQMHEAILDTRARMQRRPTEQPAPWYAPRRYARVFDWMYDYVSIHATARDFEYAAKDTPKLIGAVGGCALGMGKTMKENPKATAIVVGAVAAVAAVEYMTRYEDEEGKTHHKCAIM